MNREDALLIIQRLTFCVENLQRSLKIYGDAGCIADVHVHILQAHIENIMEQCQRLYTLAVEPPENNGGVILITTAILMRYRYAFQSA